MRQDTYNNTIDIGLVSQTFKELLQISRKTLIEKMSKGYNWLFIKLKPTESQ